LRFSVIGLFCIVVAFLAYVRLAPSSTARWHVPISATADKETKGASIRVVPNKAGAFEKLENALNTMPRTTLLAGSQAQGHVTYTTRSKWIGFPDYTTLEQAGDTIKMFARLRFGGSDLGVNAARLRKLVKALD
jgi:uncharacterized protein (DUF1499 family)